MIRLSSLLIAISLIILSACGGSSDASAKPSESSARPDVVSSLSGKAILAKARGRFEKKSNVSMNGTTSESGTDIAFKLRFSGKDASATIKSEGGVITILTVGGATYFKANDAFWKNNLGKKSAVVIARLKGRWIKATGTNTKFGELLGLADRAFVAKEFFTAQGPVFKGLTQPANGVQCISISDSIGTSKIATADARPIEISSRSDGGGDATFSYDKVDIPKAPAAADVINEPQVTSSI